MFHSTTKILSSLFLLLKTCPWRFQGTTDWYFRLPSSGMKTEQEIITKHFQSKPFTPSRHGALLGEMVFPMCVTTVSLMPFGQLTSAENGSLVDWKMATILWSLRESHPLQCDLGTLPFKKCNLRLHTLSSSCCYNFIKAKEWRGRDSLKIWGPGIKRPCINSTSWNPAKSKPRPAC